MTAQATTETVEKESVLDFFFSRAAFTGVVTECSEMVIVNQLAVVQKFAYHS